MLFGKYRNFRFCNMPLLGVSWDMCIVHTTYAYSITGNFVIIVGSILEVQIAMELCFVIVRLVNDSFTLCHLRSNMSHERLIFAM